MINESYFQLLAQVTSAFTLLIGIFVLVTIYRALHHLEDGSSLKAIIASLNRFFLITLIGVASMTIYHWVYGLSELSETTELIWYILLFAAIAYSCYGAYAFKKYFEIKPFLEKALKK